MSVSVCCYDDAAAFSAKAHEFLLARPVLHNLMLTLLDERLARYEPGRYWVAVRNGQVAGAAFHSPRPRFALLVPMDVDVTAALVDAIAEAGVVLPGVAGEVATAASFAGQWTERRKSAAIPTHGLRLYELAELNESGAVEGELRRAEAADRDLAILWVQAFDAEIHETPMDPEALVDTSTAEGRLWIWQNGEAMSMAVNRKSIAGVIRVSNVYTPPEKRRHGYGRACVYGISKHLRELGQRCILYADLGNPASNSIYRKIGYKAVSEAIQYRFDSC